MVCEFSQLVEVIGMQTKQNTVQTTVVDVSRGVSWSCVLWLIDLSAVFVDRRFHARVSGVLSRKKDNG
jgi:hypothetical protein